MQGDLSYYLNGEKVDMRKTFLGVDKIINITILNIKDAKKKFGDSLKGGALLITTKHKIRLISLLKELKKRGIDSSQIVLMKLSIDNKDISDPDILLDSEIKINLLYVGDIHDPKYQPKKEDFIGVLIFTNRKSKEKNGS